MWLTAIRVRAVTFGVANGFEASWLTAGHVRQWLGGLLEAGWAPVDLKMAAARLLAGIGGSAVAATHLQALSALTSTGPGDGVREDLGRRGSYGSGDSRDDACGLPSSLAHGSGAAPRKTDAAARGLMADMHRDRPCEMVGLQGELVGAGNG